MRLDFIACKYTHFIQYGKTIEYFFAKRIRNFAEIKRISPPMAHIKQLQKNREFMKQMKRFYSSGPVFFSNSGKLLLVPYTKDFRRITRF